MLSSPLRLALGFPARACFSTSPPPLTRLARERAAEDMLFGDRDRFVTAAYKRKLQVRHAWPVDISFRQGQTVLLEDSKLCKKEWLEDSKLCKRKWLEDSKLCKQELHVQEDSHAVNVLGPGSYSPPPPAAFTHRPLPVKA